MSKVRMLTPSQGREGVVNAVLDIVKQAGSNPCPPMVIGVGIGGDFEQCALLSKKALCRSTDVRNGDEFYATLENELLEKIPIRPMLQKQLEIIKQIQPSNEEISQYTNEWCEFTKKLLL